MSLSALAMGFQSMWSLPGVPRSLPQAWKWPSSLPALRIAAAWHLLLDVHVERVEVQLERRAADGLDHLQRLVAGVDEVGLEAVQRLQADLLAALLGVGGRAS